MHTRRPRWGGGCCCRGNRGGCHHESSPAVCICMCVDAERLSSPSSLQTEERKREREGERTSPINPVPAKREREPIMHCRLQGLSRADSSAPVLERQCATVPTFTHSHIRIESKGKHTYSQVGKTASHPLHGQTVLRPDGRPCPPEPPW